MWYYLLKFPVLQSHQNGKLQKMHVMKNNKSFYYFLSLSRETKKIYLRLMYNYASAYYVLFRSILHMIRKRIKFKKISMLSYFKWAVRELKGVRRWFKIRMQLYGIGNRVIEETKDGSRRSMLITLGWANHLGVELPQNSKFMYKTFSHFIRGRRMTTRNVFIFCIASWNVFCNTIYAFRHLKYPDAYNANGVRFHPEEVKLKARKKWGVF